MKLKNLAGFVSRSHLIVFGVSLLALSTAAAPAVGEGLFCESLPYVENIYLTTSYGAAPADVILGPENMLKCTSGEYALCYYSGPEPMPCTLKEGGVADCLCQVFTATPEHPMYVDINGILNTCIYIETTTQCGKYGQGQPGGYCPNLGGPLGHAVATLNPTVCEYIARGTFDKNADYISTFSFQTVTAPTGEVMELGCHDCTAATYAGCMTASCHGTIPGENGRQYTNCECPVFDGPYQFGRRQGTSCSLGSNQVWSAAYNPDGCKQPVLQP